MQKQKLIELFQKNMAGGNLTPDQKGKLDYRIVEKYMDIVFEKLMFEKYLLAKKYTDMSQLDSFAHPFIEKILYNSQRNRYYSLLPYSLVELPDKSAIRQISPKQTPSKSFEYIELNANAVFDNLEVNKIDKATAFWQEGQIIFYDNINEDLSEVLMKLIIRFDNYNKTDEIPLPVGQNDFFNTVKSYIITQMQIPEDKRSDDTQKIIRK